jgi:hypothetical protein
VESHESPNPTTFSKQQDSSVAPDISPAGVRRYEAPRIFVLGSIRELTLGNTSSGHKDANSQYYW